jgi:hypothetical protein
MQQQTLRAELTDLIIEACTAIGYKKRKSLYFSRAVNEDVTAWIVFGFINDSELFIAPSAGLVHKPIEELVAELSDKKFDPYGVTLGTYLGHLPPVWNQFLSYSVPAGEIPRQTVEKMMKDVEQIAVPWLNAHTTIDSFLRDLIDRTATIKESAALRIPVAYYLKGDFFRAKSFLRQHLEEIQTKPPQVIITDYPTFAARLLERMPERDRSSEAS